MEEAYQTAKTILTGDRDHLVALAERLIREETVDATAFNAIFA